MVSFAFRPIPTDVVRRLQAGGGDANGHAPERHIADGGGVPCRHCFRDPPAGSAYLILSHRPFPAPQPYAEQGPIFLCAEPCEAWSGDGAPEMFTAWPLLLMRGYDAADRIVYGSGALVAGDSLAKAASDLFRANPTVAYAHLRSATNGCFQARIERS